MDSKNEARELVAADSATRGLVVGNNVYDPLVFSPEIIQFTAKQYVFLHAYRLGVPLQDAATKAGMSSDSAERFLTKPDTVAWLRDRALRDHIQKDWEEPAKWWAVGDRWLNAPPEQKPNKNDVEIWKEFGRRVSPLADSHSGGTKIEINIDPEAIERSKARRQSIEAQIVENTNQGGASA